MTRWYCCTRCHKVESYAIDENAGDTTFPRGEFLVCATKYDAVTSGFKTRAEAEAWLEKD